MKNKDCSVVVLSCDCYEDIWEPFFILKNRYWNDCPFETYLVTESKNCKYCKTINVNDTIWTKRIRTALSQIKTKFVIIFLEDFFLREKVDNEKIYFCFDKFKKNTACFNFEKSYDEYDIDSDIKGFKIKTNKSKYKCSCQPCLWDREKLINLLKEDCSPWIWETSEPLVNYDFYISEDGKTFDYGYKNLEWFGIRGGKWCKKDVVPLFKKEKIFIDFKKRGFYKKPNILSKIYKRIVERK